MATRLENFPDEGPQAKRKYPWTDWTDGGVWQIRRGEDYGVPTENMRVNLHIKAESLAGKVKTRKFSDEQGEGLIFQFEKSAEKEMVEVEMAKDPERTAAALERLYDDAMGIYDSAREEVTIERKDGRRQKYAANRFRQQIEKGQEESVLVPTVARIVRRPTLGFGHLENAERPDLMLETLVLDSSKPYHRLFSEHTVQVARERMDDYEDRH